MKQLQKEYKRVVVKIGSSLLCSEKGSIDNAFVKEISSQISNLIKEGKEIIIVSSGAIALGMSILKLERRPKELAFLQACAAVGQHELMEVWRRLFKEDGLNCAQVLLTEDDSKKHERYLNAKNTLLTLLKLKTVPVINENDTVSTDEIRFGDKFANLS